MIDSRLTSALLAVLLGALAGIVLFVPFVAVSYRRRGTVTLGRGLLWAAGLVYFWAIWTYTLLPLPTSTTLRCAGTNLTAFAFLDDMAEVVHKYGNHPLAVLTDPVVVQVALNVVLFVPLGFFVRVLVRRGVVVSALTGLALSVFVETTQVTGVWGIYPCAYRVFDVDDMITNTVGAVIGSLLALVVAGRRGAAAVGDADRPRSVTKHRRLLAMFCDWLGFTLTMSAVQVVMRGFLLYVLDVPLAGTDLPSVVSVAAALLVWWVTTLATGRTIGDLAVQVRYGSGSLPGPVTRVLRCLFGIGGYGLLLLAPSVSGIPAVVGQLTGAFVLLSVIATLFSRNGRGLPGVLSGQTVADSRSEDSEPAA